MIERNGTHSIKRANRCVTIMASFSCIRPQLDILHFKIQQTITVVICKVMQCPFIIKTEHIL